MEDTEGVKEVVDEDMEEDFYMDKEEDVANRGRKIKKMKDCTRQKIQDVVEEEDIFQGMKNQILSVIVIKNMLTMLPSVALQNIN